jgi:hypothetical protein
MGYTPLQAGLSFLPYPLATATGAVISSKLISRSRLNTLRRAEQRDSFVGEGLRYSTDIFPFIVLMALGNQSDLRSGDLSAVHHVDEEDSGIGSGVLTTMQQVGGAPGLASLSTPHLSSCGASCASATESWGPTPAPRAPAHWSPRQV